MDESNKILKEQIEKLPKGLKEFVLKNEWSKKLDVHLSSYPIEEWQKTSIENEVFLVLMGFEEYGNLPGNIAENSEIDFEVAEKISEFVIKEILKPAADIVVSKYRESDFKPSNNIGNSFEEIILNQAKAMQPAVAAESGSGEAMPARPPENLPIEENVKQNDTEKLNLSTPNYSQGDPYREPLE